MYLNDKNEQLGALKREGAGVTSPRNLKFWYKISYQL